MGAQSLAHITSNHHGRGLESFGLLASAIVLMIVLLTSVARGVSWKVLSAQSF